MTYNLYAKQNLDSQYFCNKIEATFGFTLSKNPNYVFTFGGDGTFLDAAKIFGTKPTYIAINVGNLGFYSCFSEAGIIDPNLFKQNSRVIDLPLLEIDFMYEGKRCISHCINEVTIINPVATQILDIKINDLDFEKFRGTGICVSTPSGSTAYNKSLQGAIISNQKELFQFVKIAPINNKLYRTLSNPIILSKGDELEFLIDDLQFNESILSVDRKIFALTQSKSVKVRLADVTLKLLVSKDYNFFNRVSETFLV